MSNPQVKELFGGLRGSGKKALIPFFTAGYPSLKVTEELALTAIDSGADLIELGIPFTDPLADGPSIQFSSQWALDRGITLKSIFSLVERIRNKSEISVVLMGYVNPLIALGIDRFVRVAANSGVSGLIIPDLPPEEARELRAVAESSGVSLTFLVAPTSSRERVSLVSRASTDFVYAVTVAGVTGARSSFGRDTDRYLGTLRGQLDKSFVAGFGVSNVENAHRLAKHADGVVIGSALVNLIRANDRQTGAKKVGRLLKMIRTDLDRSFIQRSRV